MIGQIFSFLMLMYALVSIAIGIRDEMMMCYIGMGILCYSCFCLYISSMYHIGTCNLKIILCVIGMFCNNYILLSISGVLFGNWWWYLSLSTSLILLLTWCMLYNYHKIPIKEKVFELSARSRPRITFLEIE